MSAEYVPPSVQSDAFHCPYCHVYAHQRWSEAFLPADERAPYPNTDVSRCAHCDKTALWVDGTMVFPPTLSAPAAHADLPDPPLGTYNEARAVASASPRAACALLRLCIQQLVAILGAKSDDLNDAIGELVARGLPEKIQKSLDAVRLIGNGAIHPGKIDLNDDPKVALILFDLVNLIVDSMITQPAMVQAVYDRLPQGKRDQIERRDQGARSGDT